jgi:lysine biosynthesis protein LysW
MEKGISCPDCKQSIRKKGDVLVGDVLECPNCGCEVEILSVEPLKYRELLEEK